MFNDLNDTGLLPVDDDNSSHIASFDTRQMHWRLDSLNSSTNTLASAVFKLSTYQGVELDSTTNVQITVSLKFYILKLMIYSSTNFDRAVDGVWQSRPKLHITSFGFHGKLDAVGSCL